MKKSNVTFSLPEETLQQLRSFVGQRKMSSFVAQAIEDALSKRVEFLKKAYIEADQDEDRQEVLADWNVLDVEGWE